MKFKCKRADLLDAINVTDRAVAVKSTMYILEGIYICAKNSEVRFLGNNLELGIDFVIPAEIEQEGEIVVKASLFSDAVRKLPEQENEVYIEVNNEKIINLCCGFAKFDFATFNVDEFPKLPEVTAEKSFALKENILKQMLKQTIYAVALNDTKPVLTGIFFDIKESMINVVGCDGYRLAISKQKTDGSEIINFIMPGKTAKELLSILGDTDYEILFTISKKYIKLQLKNCILISRLVEGEYMDYNTVLKNNSTTIIFTDTRKILNSIDRASLIINETMKIPVVLNIQDDMIYVNCESVIGKVKDQIGIDMNGELLEIAFNHKYLMDALKNIDSDKVKISFSTSSNPAVIEPADDKNNFISIVTPVRMKK